MRSGEQAGDVAARHIERERSLEDPRVGGDAQITVRWRTTGMVDLTDDDELLRFYVADLNHVINKAAADAELYGSVLDYLGYPENWQALVLSTYATPDEDTAHRLTEAWRGRDFLVARVGDLRANQIPIWPTATFREGQPDEFNDIHFDVVVLYGPQAVPEGMAGTKSERRHARAALRPRFEEVLSLFRPKGLVVG